MPDIISFILIVALAAIVVYGLHVLREMRNELGIRQRVTALEEKVFGTAPVLEPVVPIPQEKRARVRKPKVVA